LNYRLYTLEDFAPLYAIEEICFQPPDRFSRHYLRLVIHRANAATWIAEEDGGMAGFAIVEWEKHPDGITAYIPTLEVLPQMRGRGIGKQLLHHLENSACAAHASMIGLHVDTANQAAIRLYTTHGYINVGREEHYYALCRAALIYKKILKP
jgi:ribosomal protein S18 acetylase RimI-like enzyme